VTSEATREKIRSSGPPTAPPTADPVKIGRVAGKVDLLTIELVGSHFGRTDNDALPAEPPAGSPEFAIGVEWKLDEASGLLGCLLTFGAEFEGDSGPYSIVARYRGVYSVEGSEDLSDDEIDQFAQWNAVFNVWPYWREFVSGIVDRANLPRVVVPVMRVPGQGATAAE
jgi:hypothetical protein